MRANVVVGGAARFASQSACGGIVGRHADLIHILRRASVRSSH